jgi:hypothetical protein
MNFLSLEELLEKAGNNGSCKLFAISSACCLTRSDIRSAAIQRISEPFVIQSRLKGTQLSIVANKNCLNLPMPDDPLLQSSDVQNKIFKISYTRSLLKDSSVVASREDQLYKCRISASGQPVD